MIWDLGFSRIRGIRAWGSGVTVYSAGFQSGVAIQGIQKQLLQDGTVRLSKNWTAATSELKIFTAHMRVYENMYMVCWFLLDRGVTASLRADDLHQASYCVFNKV